MTDLESELELDAELAELRRSYARELPRKLDQLGELLQGAFEARDRESVDAARQLAHSLMGSSGSYGFRTTSQELKRIEDSLESLLEAETLDLEARWPEIERAFDRARRVLPGS